MWAILVSGTAKQCSWSEYDLTYNKGILCVPPGSPAVPDLPGTGIGGGGGARGSSTNNANGDSSAAPALSNGGIAAVGVVACLITVVAAFFAYRYVNNSLSPLNAKGLASQDENNMQRVVLGDGVSTGLGGPSPTATTTTISDTIPARASASARTSYSMQSSAGAGAGAGAAPALAPAPPARLNPGGAVTDGGVGGFVDAADAL